MIVIFAWVMAVAVLLAVLAQDVRELWRCHVGGRLKQYTSTHTYENEEETRAWTNSGLFV